MGAAPRGRDVLRLLALAALGLLYLWAGYWATATAQPPLAALLIGFVPMALIALVALWHGRWRWPLLVAWLLALTWLLARLAWLQAHAAWLFFLQHAGAMAVLAATFAATLFGRHADALCSRVAMRVVPQDMDAAFARYTWQVTLAWSLFFLAMGTVSVALFLLGPASVWATFASLGTPLAVGGMFVAEYALRVRALPGRRHLGVWATISAYRRHGRGDGGAASAPAQPLDGVAPGADARLGPGAGVP